MESENSEIHNSLKRSREKIKSHRCSPECVKDEEKAKCDPKSYRVLHNHSGILRYNESPFCVPFDFNWKRLDYCYETPCGLKLYTSRQVRRYLLKTKSLFSIDQFNLDNTINLFFAPSSVPPNRVRCHDVSNGLENVPIQVINEVDDSDIDSSFQYTTSYVNRAGISLNEGFVSCCTCTDACTNVDKCECRQLTREATKYDIHKFVECDGYTNEKTIPRPYLNGLFECNDQCSCFNGACYNRVSQEGIKAQLQIYRDPVKGWAVRCLHDLPAGSFVCTYTGELFSNEQCEDICLKRGDDCVVSLDLIETIENKIGYESDADENLLDLSLLEGSDEEPSIDLNSSSDSDSHEEKPAAACKRPKLDGSVESIFGRDKRLIRMRSYFMDELIEYKVRSQLDDCHSSDSEVDTTNGLIVIDGKVWGNVGRFINHSCSPNCYLQNVFTFTHDPRFHTLAFFTFHSIKANTELTWDYGYFGKKAFSPCLCGSDECRDPPTVNGHT